MAVKRKHIIITAAAICVIAIAAFAGSLTTSKSEKIYVVEKGPFEATLTCKGEINGLVSTPIPVPEILGDRELRLWELKILDLAQDGKYVKKGDFIMQLDANQIMSGMRQEQQTLETAQADLNNAKIDSTVQLNGLREDIKNAMLDLEYNKIDLEQSIYESAAYQRKAQMTYKKAENTIAKKQRDYQLEQNKLKMRVSRYEERVKRSQDKIAKFQQAMQAARITAPEDGIVIFGESWDGTKYSKDGDISTWSNGPPIATLPDMSEVISEIYVKEIDISKIKVNDKVRVTFDALEGVVVNGKITSIARVGEDHKDFDMKVFKVIIHLEESNDGLKPAMSSNNEIILAQKEGALFVPLKAVIRANGEDFVYLLKHNEKEKTPVITSFENDEFVLIESGLQEGDQVILNPVLEEI